MSLFAPKPPKPKNQTATPDAPAVAETASFTNGAQWGAKAFSAAAIVCLLCGPLALGLAMTRPAPKAAAAVVSTDEVPSSLQQTAGAYGVGLVGAWLSSTKTDTAGLQAYVATAPAGLGDVPYQYRNLAVADITVAAASTLATVLIAGDVYEIPAGEDTAVWVQRFFEVTVDTADDQLAAVGLPAPVAGPKTAASVSGIGLTIQLPSTAPASETVQLMLASYLTGVGATSSYLTPGVSIDPIVPAPFTSVAPVSFHTDRDPGDAPNDGDALLVQAVMMLQTATGQQVTATYFVHLTARAGRWEVSGLGTTTPTDRDTATPSSTTSPTGKPAPSPSGGTPEGVQQ